MAAVFRALQYATESASATMDRTKLAVVSEKFPLIVSVRPSQLTEDLKQRKKKRLEALNNNYQTPAPANETIFQISCTEVNLKASFSESEHCGCYSRYSKIAAFLFSFDAFIGISPCCIAHDISHKRLNVGYCLGQD